MAGGVRSGGVRAVRIEVRVGALAGEDAEEHPHIRRGTRRAGGATQAYPRDREVEVLRKVRELQREGCNGRVGLALVPLPWQQRKSIVTRRVGERRRRVQIAER